MAQTQAEAIASNTPGYIQQNAPIPALFKPQNKRSIFNYATNSFIDPYVVVFERHSDPWVVTDHPTEFGTTISDNMYALPKRVDLELVYSLSGSGWESNTLSINDYYQMILNLQASAQPFTLITGKRYYPQMMVITDIIEDTTSKTENYLRLFLNCREVIIVSISTKPNQPQVAQPINNKNVGNGNSKPKLDPNGPNLSVFGPTNYTAPMPLQNVTSSPSLGVPSIFDSLPSQAPLTAPSNSGLLSPLLQPTSAFIGMGGL
jgi:hypothetical protein